MLTKQEKSPKRRRLEQERARLVERNPTLTKQEKSQKRRRLEQERSKTGGGNPTLTKQSKFTNLLNSFFVLQILNSCNQQEAKDIHRFMGHTQATASKYYWHCAGVSNAFKAFGIINKQVSNNSLDYN